MEVFDFEDDHLASVLPNDRGDGGEDASAEESFKKFVSPTEEEKTRSKLAADRQRKEPRCYTKMSALRGTLSSNRVELSVETDTSSQRYQHLPAYAQTTFVEEAIPKKRDPPKDLPAGMTVPTEDRQDTILRRTAQSVAESPQLEFMLRVKQADNPDLYFLQPDDQFHPYYQWCKGSIKRKNVAATNKERSIETGTTALGGLLDAYSSSSSDDDNDDTTSIPVIASKRPTAMANTDDDEAAQKARRLERAKKLREHFREKMRS